MKVSLERNNWVLLVLANAKDRALTPIQLQKSLFLVGAHLGKRVGKKYYKFAPYDYGPFSPEIYADAEELERAELVSISYASNLRWKLYSITPLGLEAASEVLSKLPSNVSDQIEIDVKWVLEKSFRELVKSIYSEFPEYSANSVFRG